ncbi:MAG TPA: hypothetical protein VGR14_00520 [Verrucomicrobiae bacterium]|jgi:hypothetical protein|nr:hypothetical protein [Verrucomicrobiae bacterium]
MAIWQFGLDFIPHHVVRGKYEPLPVTLPKQMAEDYPWWADIQPPFGFEEWIDDVLARANALSQNMRMWGKEDGDSAFVCYDDNAKSRVTWIGFRVDVRQLSQAFVKSICMLGGRLECLLLTSTYHLLTPQEQEILGAINISVAMNYRKDPVSTLRSLKHTATQIIPLPQRIEPKNQQKPSHG